MARFFIAGTNFPNGRAIIRGRDADHIRVLRLRAGDDIVICDGAGRDYKCCLVQTLEHEAEAKVIEVVPCKAEPTVRTTVFAGLPKGERSDFLVQKCTEAGAAEIVFFSCTRCVAKAVNMEKKLERWQRIAEEAAKQSGRGIIPQVRYEADFVAVLNGALHTDLPLFMYETGERETIRDAIEHTAQPIASAAIITGPEAFAVLAAALDETQADVCYFGLRMTGDNDGAVFTDDLPLHTPLTLQETPALLLNRPSACIAAWRRTLFTDTGIRFRARGWGEDLCMTRKMLTAARSVVILPDVLYLYRQHEGSVTKRALDANAEIMDAIDDVLTWYQARGLFEQYENELGKLCVDNVLYDASVRILKAQSAHPLLPQLLDFTAARFPDYRHNPYLKGYPARKKLVLSLLGKQQYRAVHLLFAAAGH